MEKNGHARHFNWQTCKNQKKKIAMVSKPASFKKLVMFPIQLKNIGICINSFQLGADISIFWW